MNRYIFISKLLKNILDLFSIEANNCDCLHWNYKIVIRAINFII